MTIDFSKAPSPTLSVDQVLVNNSGQGKGYLPDGVAGWSWGAFTLSWIWAICNRTWIGLLVFFPYVGFVMAVVLGIKGREWAWQNKRWDSVDHFNRVQRRWSVWGVCLLLVPAVVGIVAAIAIPKYHDSVDKPRMAAALDHARAASQAVGRYVVVARALPPTLQDAGFDAPLPEGVQAATIDPDTGYVSVTMRGGSVDGRVFHLAPGLAADGKVTWRCLRGDVPLRLLPGDCRYDTADPFPLAQPGVR